MPPKKSICGQKHMATSVSHVGQLRGVTTSVGQDPLTAFHTSPVNFLGSITSQGEGWGPTLAVPHCKCASCPSLPSHPRAPFLRPPGEDGAGGPADDPDVHRPVPFPGQVDRRRGLMGGGKGAHTLWPRPAQSPTHRKMDCTPWWWAQPAPFLENRYLW